MIEKFFKKQHDNLYVVFRIIIGLLFFVHGAQKWFGWFGSKGVAAVGSLFWFAGIIETIAGLFLVIGLYSRLVAFISAGEMAFAYFIAHFPRGVFPYQNGGETALLFMAAFFVIIIHGSKKFSIERALCKGKECF
jgi:putative oxidoreductase